MGGPEGLKPQGLGVKLMCSFGIIQREAETVQYDGKCRGLFARRLERLDQCIGYGIRFYFKENMKSLMKFKHESYIFLSSSCY